MRGPPCFLFSISHQWKAVMCRTLTAHHTVCMNLCIGWQYQFRKSPLSHGWWTTVKSVADIWLSTWTESEICQLSPSCWMETLGCTPTVGWPQGGTVLMNTLLALKMMCNWLNRVKLGLTERLMSFERHVNRKPTGWWTQCMWIQNTWGPLIQTRRSSRYLLAPLNWKWARVAWGRIVCVTVGGCIRSGRWIMN